MMRLRKGIFTIFFLLTSCSGLQRSEEESLRRNNAQGECILRNHDEYHYVIAVPRRLVRERYPWERTEKKKEAEAIAKLPCPEKSIDK